MTSPSEIPCRFCHKLPGGKFHKAWCINNDCAIYWVPMTLAQWEAGVVTGWTEHCGPKWMIEQEGCMYVHDKKDEEGGRILPVLVIPLKGD